jgi:hypothetical protein
MILHLLIITMLAIKVIGYLKISRTLKVYSLAT